MPRPRPAGSGSFQPHFCAASWMTLRRRPTSRVSAFPTGIFRAGPNAASKNSSGSRPAAWAAAYHGGNEHSGKPSVQAEFGGASYFGERICAAGRLADKLEVRRILQRRIIWRRNPGCKSYKLSVKKSFLRRQMDDRAVFRTARGALHIPFPRGCGNQHFASGGPGFAQIVIRSANAQASSRKLVAILRIEVGLDNLDAAPIAGKFLRDNHGQRRANALSDLGLAAPDLHSAVLRNFEPSVWQKGARRIG